LQAYESSARYDPIGEPGKSTDRGGCVNNLTNQRSQSKKSSSMAPGACLIELELFVGELPATEGAA
jgi:trimethylamine-N-oxide reductase (cytochrome c)